MRFVAVAQPVVDFHFRLCFAVAIPLLQYTGEFFRLATQSGGVIVGEFAPLLPRLAFELMPLAVQTGRLDDSSVHDTRMAGKPKLFWLILIVLITRMHRPVVLNYAAGGGGTTGLVNGVIS